MDGMVATFAKLKKVRWSEMNTQQSFFLIISRCMLIISRIFLILTIVKAILEQKKSPCLLRVIFYNTFEIK